MRFASCMAPVSEPLFVDTAHFVAKKLGVEVSLAHDVDWETRERMLDEGQVDVGWICGLPYILKADLPAPTVELLAAPVMIGERYGGAPVYFSDVMVREDSPYHSFEHLRGARWAINEPLSHSGCNVVRSHLFDLGELSGYFGSIHAAGSHERAIELLIDGQIDAAAIDTTVYEIVIRAQPNISTLLRTIDTLGPSPIPPWVISTKVDPSLHKQVQEILLRMHAEPDGRRILDQHGCSHYTLVDDHFYDPIRSMDQKARQVDFDIDSP